MPKFVKSSKQQQIEFSSPVETVFSRPIAWEHTFYLGDIEAPQNYYEWYQIIRNADVNDHIKISINSGGGSYAAALQFRNAMMESDATITCTIEGECHSAATIIFLSGDVYSVSAGSNMLVHDYSGIVGGKGSEMIRQIQHEKISIDSFLEEVYRHFLTDDEIAHVLAGQDMWLNEEEIIKRTKQMVDAQEEEIKEYIDNQKKENLDEDDDE